MYGKFQKTISKTIIFEGIGLHSGKKASIKLLPAEANSGIVLKELILIKITSLRQVIKM